ncbi:TonB family protein [candidate division KSB1 bacterium]|nr:TonB family protein [candidate division KSB1 bacterium]
MIDLINEIGSRWAEFFGLMVLQNTIFLGLVFLMLLLLKNASARAKYTIALIGLVKLLLPPFLPGNIWQISFINFNTTGTVEIGEISVLNMAVAPTSSPFDLNIIIFILWAMVVGLYLFLALGSTFLLKNKFRKAEFLKQDAILNSKIRLYRSNQTMVPLSIGLFPNRIILPANWQELPSECREMMLEHELAHIRRKDGFVQFLQLLAQAIYFFHPLVWFLNERLNEYREMVCDDEAVANTKITPVKYSRYLVFMAENMVQTQWSYVSVTALIKQKHKLLNRINYQLKEKTMYPKIKYSGLAILLFLLIIPLSWYTPAESSPIAADDSNLGNITGIVKMEKQNKVLSNVTIELEGTQFNVKTDENGAYKIIDIAPGTFTLVARKDGFKTVKLGNINVQAGKNSQLNVALKPEKTGEVPPPPPPVLIDKKIDTIIDKEIDKGVDLASPPPPPPPKVEKKSNSAEYDKAPEPVGGLYALQMNVKYPEAARKKGFQRNILVQAAIDVDGKVLETKIIKVQYPTGVAAEKESDEETQKLTQILCTAAMDAIKATKWNPALKDNKPVKAQVMMPINFRLHGEKSSEKLVEFDTPPEPIDGFAAVQKNLKYPEAARKKGVERTVYIQVLIDVDGKVLDTRAAKPSDEKESKESEMDEETQKMVQEMHIAAMKAIEMSKWEPAKKDNQPVKVWITVPVRFKLK